MKPSPEEQKLSAIAHWRKLADDQDAMAAHERARGSSDAPQLARAATYRRTARAIELELETGTPHCSVCLGPHPNHDCPKRPGAQR